MILYAAHGTSNLGDFFNSLPVLSGISKKYGKYILVIQNDMVRFNGIIELLKAQDIFLDVFFENNFNNLNGDIIVPFNSWVREEQTFPIRPIETCRYEIRFKEDYNMEFNVDDDFILTVPYIETPDTTGKYILGDRCKKTSYDDRRKFNLIPGSKYEKDGFYMDYDKSLIWNLNLIKQSKLPFISTITGISIVVDLMNVDQIILYDKELIEWQNRGGIEGTFKRHYYLNRKCILEYIDE